MATFQAVWVYVWSFFSGELLALGGNSGNVIYDVCPSPFFLFFLSHLQYRDA